MEKPDNRWELIKIVNKRLFCLLLVLFVLLITYLGMIFYERSFLPLLPLVVLSGLTGGFIGIQRRIRSLDLNELELITVSWLATSLPALYGGILAIVMYVLFLSEIITGPLFPTFESTQPMQEIGSGIESIINTKVVTYQDAARLIFWSFVAGYSERFVPLIVESTESRASNDQDS